VTESRWSSHKNNVHTPAWRG